MAQNLNSVIQSVVKHQNANKVTDVKSAFVFNETVDQYLIAQLKGLMPNVSTIPPDYLLYVAWLKAQIDNKTITGKPVTADSDKVVLSGEYTDAALTPFGIDIDPSKIEINDLDGVLEIIKGGTGLSTIGTSGQLIRVNALGTALEYFTAPYPTTAITSINSLTAASQTLTTGTAGADFAISSSVATHTFNLPIASATNTGKLSNTDWTTFNNKFDLPSQTGNSGKFLGTNGSTASWQSIPTYTRLNDNDTVAFYDYCGTALTGTSTSSPTWLIRRINWSSTTPVTQQALGAWTGRTTLTYI